MSAALSPSLRRRRQITAKPCPLGQRCPRWSSKARREDQIGIIGAGIAYRDGHGNHGPLEEQHLDGESGQVLSHNDSEEKLAGDLLATAIENVLL